MNAKSLLWILGLCALSQGCSPFYYTVNTMIVEPMQYNDAADKGVELTRDCQLAKAAWRIVQQEHAEKTYSPDYADGFKDGFVDYLYAGGKGLPPALPPRRYWKPKYESPEGHQAIEDWFSGFTHGSATAQASGYRNLIPVPASSKAEQKSDEYRVTYGKQSRQQSSEPEKIPQPRPERAGAGDNSAELLEATRTPSVSQRR